MMNTTGLSLLSCISLLVVGLVPSRGWARAAEDPALAQKIRAFQDKNNPGRADLAHEFRELGPKAKAAVPALTEAVRDDPNVRWWAAQALGFIGAAAIPSLLETLELPDQDIKICVLRALGIAGADARPAVPRLLQELTTDDLPVRMAVIQALGTIPDPKAVQALTDLLLADPDYAVRYRAAIALGFQGHAGKAAVPALIKVMREMMHIQASGQFPKVRDSTHHVFGTSFSFLDEAAWTALVSIGGPAVPALVPLLRDPDLVFRACEIFGRMGPEAKAAVPALTKLLRNHDPEVRWTAAQTVGAVGTGAAPALPSLRRLFRDSSPYVRIFAAKAVWCINHSLTKR